MKTQNKSVAVFLCITGLYIFSYAINSLLGGYWIMPEYDRNDPRTPGEVVRTAIQWQPWIGYHSLSNRSVVGSFYAPLIVADRALVHRTRYFSDETVYWGNRLPRRMFHPKWRPVVDWMRPDDWAEQIKSTVPSEVTPGATSDAR